MERKRVALSEVVEYMGKKYRAERELKQSCWGCDLYKEGERLCGDRSWDCPCGSHLIFKKIKEVKETPRHRIELGVVKVEGDNVTFRIVEQTHRLNEFSQQGSVFRAFNGFSIGSSAYPAWGAAVSDMLWVRGDEIDKDNTELHCSVAKFAIVCEAITEYNASNGKGYEKPWPRRDDRYFFVSERGKVDSTCFGEREFDYNLKEIGNFFRTSQEAEAAADKVRALLKELAAK